MRLIIFALALVGCGALYAAYHGIPLGDVTGMVQEFVRGLS